MKTFSEINITNTNPNKRSKKKKTPHPNERSNVAKKHKGPASLFCREAQGLFGA